MSVVNRAVFSSGSSNLFLRGANRTNQSSKSPGSCQIDGHNNVRSRTGSRDPPTYQDHQGKGLFVNAGRGSMFYCHHSNVDRLWTVWKILPDQASRGGRWETRYPDFPNTQFSFYDHNKRLVHVKVKDPLDTHNLSYSYDTMDSDSDGIKFTTRSFGKPSQSEIGAFARTPKVLSKDESKSFLLTRREPTDDEIRAGSDEGLTPDELEEALVVKGMKVPTHSYMAFRIFINLPSADISTPLDLYEFVGLITNIPQSRSPDRGVDFRLSIGSTLKGLNIPDYESVVVTFVPQEVEDDVPFDGLETEWL